MIHPLLSLLWALNAAAQLALAALLLKARGPERRRALSTYPLFTAYILYCALGSLALAAVRAWLGSPAYLVAYWIHFAAEPALLLGAIFELFRLFFWPVSILPRRSATSFLATLGGVFAIAVLATAVAPGTCALRYLLVLRNAQRVVSILSCGALLALIALVKHFPGIPWRPYAYAIAAGLMQFLPVRIAVWTVKAYHSGNEVNAWLTAVGMISFLFTVVTWLFLFARREPVRPTISRAQLQPLLRLLAGLNIPTVLAAAPRVLASRGKAGPA